ncbi:MAG: VCBS repeat-containing protein [bacterium]|nr:VCBS repeat-containing protein [bacterium]
MMFGDFDNDGVDELVFWNQKGAPKGLYLAEIPADPTTPGEWQRTQIADIVREGLDRGDVDGDGIDDIVVGGYWFKWNGGTDYTAIEIDPDFRQGQVAVGDLNEDGQLDVVLSSGDRDGPLLLYEYVGDPTVTANWIPTDLLGVITDEAHSLEIADIDGDGQLDIFAAEMNLSGNNEDAKTWVLFGDGTGQFRSTEVAVGIGNHESTLGDLDGDGDLDILGKGFHETEINIWFNTLNEVTLGAWGRTVIDDARPWRAIFETEGDMDGVGDLDIVTGGWWYQNPGSVNGVWQRNTIGDPLNNMAAVHDFDGDGDLDVLGTEGVGSTANNSFVWAQNDGSGNFTIFDNVENGVGSFLQGTTVASLSPGEPLTVVLSWQNGAGGTQALTVPDDPTTDTWAWSQLTPVSQGEGLDHGDIDGDGDEDLLLGFKWLRNDDGVWTDFVLHLEPPLAEPDRVHLVDMDGDGDLDSLVGYGHESSVTTLAWYEQLDDETALWTEHVITNNLTGNPQSVDYADMDGDGDVDVVAGEHLPNDPGDLDLFVFENTDGVGDSWTQYTVYSGDEHHDAAHLADLDQDGDLDIYSIGWTHNNVIIYENLTNGFDGLEI